MTGLCPLAIVGSNPTAVMVYLNLENTRSCRWQQYRGAGARGFDAHRVFFFSKERRNRI